MPRIAKVLAAPATGAYYVTDLGHLQRNPIALPHQYTTRSLAAGHRFVREVAEAVSVGLRLSGPEQESSSGGPVTWGDCVGVAYAGRSGRYPVFRTADGLRTIRRRIAPVLEGREITTFQEMSAEIDALTEEARVPTPPSEAPQGPPRLDDTAADRGLSRRDLLTAPLRAFRSEASSQRPDRNRPSFVAVERHLHPAVRYGASQALLRAVAAARGVTMAEVIADEWGLPLPGRPVPIHAQSGADRRRSADKMIVRRVASLPHALVEDIPSQLGADGEQLVRYVRWLKDRIGELGGPDYRPAIHLDVHGALGAIYEGNLGRILGYLYRLESSAQPYTLRIESPIIKETRAAQIEAMKTLRGYVRFRRMAVKIVADEWANTLADIRAFIDAEAADMIQIKMPDLGALHNTVEAVLACKAAGIGAFLGGSCVETDQAAQVAAHVALATQPDIVLARPGMGVDEAVSIVQNEMTRALVSVKTRATDCEKDPAGGS